ncbi:MAG: type I-E CRISPR-associated protein Cas6/Cse3/CasE [Verrucomicrobiales bacterium]
MNERLHLARALVPYEVAVKRGMTDPYAWHQRAWDAFPSRDRQPRDFLTRLEEKDDVLQLMILSPTPPERPGWCPTDGWQVKPIPEDFLGHEEYDFSLLANPTRKLVVRDEAGQRRKNGRRIAITHREDRPDTNAPDRMAPGLLSWLQRHGMENGFAIVPDQTRTIPQPFRRFHKEKHTVSLHAVDFRGRLQVTDRARFRSIFHGRPDPVDPARLIYGLGRAKGFGFGLLAVVPVS